MMPLANEVECMNFISYWTEILREHSEEYYGIDLDIIENYAEYEANHDKYTATLTRLREVRLMIIDAVKMIEFGKGQYKSYYHGEYDVLGFEEYKSNIDSISKLIIHHEGIVAKL